MALRRTIDAVSEPITVDEAKTHCRVTLPDDDVLIAGYIKAARITCENELRRSLITQTWLKTVDAFSPGIELPYPPVQSITSIRYLDFAGDMQTLDPLLYTLDNQTEPGWVVPAYGETWPDTLCAINAVEITYVAGYLTADDVPQSIKNWIALQVGHWYENREASMPGVSIMPMPFIGGLLDAYRVVSF